MKYSFVFQNKSYNLPNYNVEMVRKLEALDEQGANASSSEQLQLLYNYINETLGEEVTNNILGGFDDADPNEINIVYGSIVNAYHKPLEEHELKEHEAFINKNLKAVQSDKLVNLVSVLGQASDKINK